MDRNMVVRHLCRNAKTALELAIAAQAPTELLDRLAMTAGFLDAISHFPMDSAPALALVPGAVDRAKKTLDDWHGWEKKHLPKASA